MVIKRAMITGGTGMLGLALMRLLVQEGIEVLVLVHPGSSKCDRIPSHPLIRAVPCGLEDLHELQVEETYDAFFHFAWAGTYGDGRNQMYLQTDNIRYTLDAVELARRSGCQVFCGAGSQAEYGRVEGKLSSATPVHPETGYGMAKLCAGKMSRRMCAGYGMRHIWFRILSTYGPFDGAQTMVMSGIRQMLAGQRPRYTKGEQLWDYLHCDDAARAFYLAACRGKDGAVYCVGSGQPRYLKEYITAIRDAAAPGMEIGLGEVPYFENQVMYLCADLTELTEDTGFVPQISFEEGIAETVRWCRAQQDASQTETTK